MKKWTFEYAFSTSIKLLLAISVVGLLASCGTETKQVEANQQYVYVSKALEISGPFSGKLIIAKGQECCLKNENPNNLFLKEMSFSYRAILLDQPIDTASNAVIGHPAYMPPEKDVSLLELIFRSGTNQLEVFDKNIGKRVRLTCHLRHAHNLIPRETSKVNCTVVNIDLEPS